MVYNVFIFGRKIFDVGLPHLISNSQARKSCINRIFLSHLLIFYAVFYNAQKKFRTPQKYGRPLILFDLTACVIFFCRKK